MCCNKAGQPHPRPRDAIKNIKTFHLQLANELIGDSCSHRCAGHGCAAVLPLPLRHFPSRSHLPVPTRGVGVDVPSVTPSTTSEQIPSGIVGNAMPGCVTLGMRRLTASCCGTRDVSAMKSDSVCITCLYNMLLDNDHVISM